MEFKEIKNKKTGDLHGLLAELREKLRVLRFKDSGKQLKNIREIRVVRNDIARVLTALNNEQKENTSEVKVETVSEDKK